MKTFRNSQIVPLFLAYFLLIMTGLTGCVDLSGSKSTYSEKKLLLNSSTSPKTEKKTRIKHKKPSLYRGEVHTMRGGLGIFSIGMNQLRDKVDNQYHVPAYSSMWYNNGEVSRSIISYYYKHKDHRPIILIGHSLGANEQIQVANDLKKAGIPVDLLVTVDAVSVTKVPSNVKYALNVYKPGFVPMFSGLKLKAINPDTTHVENVNVNELKDIKVNHFVIEKHPAVQAIIMAKVEKVLRNAKRKEA